MNEKDFSKALEDFIGALGEDPKRAGLERTPARVWEAMHFLTRGYREDLSEILKDSTFEEPSRDMVIIRNISFNSLCEHHMLPFFGTAHVGYIPDGRVIGLSKVARVVDHFACRMQVQERMTAQIAGALEDELRPQALAVTISATHLCMAVRGVMKPDSRIISSAWRGRWASDVAARDEYLAGIKL